MKNKIIPAFLATLLTVALLASPVFALSFPDVDAHSGYAPAIEAISEWGIMVGDTQGNFNPDKIVSRAEMATIICRMLGMEENLPRSTAFTDVPATHWANASVGKASEFGIVNGYGEGKFGPSDPVTYEQAVTMIVRGIGRDESATRLGGYPKGYLQVAEEGSLLEGVPAQQGQGMSRGAVAILLYNYFKWNPAKPGDGHTHRYEERTMPGSGTGGHYEQVQTGTKEVEEWGQVTIYGCVACSFTTKDPDEMSRHNSTSYSPKTTPCWGCRTWSQTKTEVIGTHEEPIYENKWVDGSAITIRVCALCGQME